MARISFGSSTKAVAAAGLTLLVSATMSYGLTGQADTEKYIGQTLGKLRQMPDADRAVATKRLALLIRELPAGVRKVGLANSLANLATEGDFGRDTLQEVTTTLSQALAEAPKSGRNGEASPGYDELAQLAKYEQMKVTLKSAEYTAAVDQLNALDDQRKKVDFTLNDTQGNAWTLSSLKGKIVLVNFWATWCPPCRKEMPDLQVLYDRFKSKGFVILSISDEPAGTVNPFIADHKYTWPILLDPGRNVNSMYKVTGIPKSFLYNRQGQLVAQTIDMRTQAQFLALLGKVGLR